MAKSRTLRFITACKLLVLVGIAPLLVGEAHAGGSETELQIGVSTATVADTVVPGVAVGVGLTLQPHQFYGGALEVRVSVMPSFGSSSDSPIDVQALHLPVTAGISLFEMRSVGSGPSIGGAIALGALISLGRYGINAFDVQPCAAFDLSLGVFKRGALKIRYTTVLGAGAPANGGTVTYQSLVVVGSTTW